MLLSISQMDAVPLSVALVAGSLAAFNPCGFPVLLAFLASRLGGDSSEPMPATGRLANGIGAGLLVAAGFVGTFTVIGLPVGYGLNAVGDAVPWIGLAFAGLLIALGIAVLGGRAFELPIAAWIPTSPDGGPSSPIMFGIGHGLASLGCTLPIFLSLLGAASASSRLTSTMLVFVAYGLGLALVLIVLATGAALARDGLGRLASGLVPHVGRLSGALLVVAGGYLGYFWLRSSLGSPADAATDPLIGAITDFGAWIQAQAQKSWVLAGVLGLAALVLGAAVVSFRGRKRLTAGALALLIVGGLVGYQTGAGGARSTVVQSGGESAGDVGGLPPIDAPARAATEEDLQALRAEGRAAELADLQGLGHLRDLFDAASSRPRIIAVLSPTCVTCLRGAAWLQEQLATHPDADIAVYAVWLPVLPTDERTTWEDRILTDSRVVHLWDDEAIIGRWYSERGYGELPVQWDALFVYSPSSSWGDREEPSDLVIWRRPIIVYAGELTTVLDSLLSE